MNDRLRELMIEAGYAAPELAGRAQKLAELIVRDIASDLRELAKHMEVTGSEAEAYILRTSASGIELKYGVE